MREELAVKAAAVNNPNRIAPLPIIFTQVQKIQNIGPNAREKKELEQLEKEAEKDFRKTMEDDMDSLEIFDNALRIQNRQRQRHQQNIRNVQKQDGQNVPEIPQDISEKDAIRLVYEQSKAMCKLAKTPGGTVRLRYV